jgi:hypothetical protein
MIQGLDFHLLSQCVQNDGKHPSTQVKTFSFHKTELDREYADQYNQTGIPRFLVIDNRTLY